MTDSYQAIYDAVRSRISGGNVSDALTSVIRDAFDISYAKEGITHELLGAIARVELAATSPSVLYRPALSADGTMWCALYGENLQVGIAGFGDTPDAAMRAFDAAWGAEKTPAAIRLER